MALKLTGSTKWTSAGTEFASTAINGGSAVTSNDAALVYDCYKVTFTVSGGNCASYTLDPASATQYLKADAAAHIVLTGTGTNWLNSDGTPLYVIQANGFNDADVTTDNSINVSMTPTVPLTSDLNNVLITYASKS